MIDRIQEPSGVSAPGLDDIKEQALNAWAVARERLTRSGQVIRDYTHEQPVRALGVALGVGVFLGWLIKRR